MTDGEKKKLTAKERMAIHNQKVPEQDPLLRARNFEEVSLGYGMDAAMLEAERCLQCPTAPCVNGCPVGINIPKFIEHIRDGEILEAAKVIRESNALPAVTGRVCPQESQCEGVCIRSKTGVPVNIGKLERFAADFEMQSEKKLECEDCERTGMKVAVVGSGPAGLTVAGDLALKGHDVTVFEAMHKPGGVLQYGIPEFRLPKSIVDAEVANLEKMGVVMEYNKVIGTAITVKELLGPMGFDAAFIGVGAGLPKFLGIEGENLCGVYSANEYLTRVNLMKAYQHPRYVTPMPRGRNVVVVGGGNVAMDAARTALRLGADKVSIVYRRSREEMPARIEEVHHAEEEGIDFQLLTNPVGFIGDDGQLKGLRCLRMELGEPDASGRRRPIPIEGSEFVIDCDLAVISIGSGSNPLLTSTMEDLELNDWGYIKIGPCGDTSVEGVYAGGDIVTGAATVILAMGAGRIAADNMHKYLMFKKQNTEGK